MRIAHSFLFYRKTFSRFSVKDNYVHFYKNKSGDYVFVQIRRQPDVCFVMKEKLIVQIKQNIRQKIL